jgi:ribose-phosphate pyrophosphokinase
MHSSAPYALVSTRTAIKLAGNLSKRLHIPLLPVERTEFVNCEVRLRLAAPVRGKHCLLVANMGAPVHDNLFELLFLADLLNTSGAKDITALIPYFAYSRQHRRFRSGESESFQTIVKALTSVGVRKVVTVDFHNEQALSETKLPFEELSAISSLAEHIKKHVPSQEIVAVSPDEGGITRAKRFAAVGDFPFTYIYKKRRLEKAHHIARVYIDDPSAVKDKTVVLVDDISTSGKTLLLGANECLKHGAKEIYAVVVHADMNSLAVKKLAHSKIKKVFTTDTLPVKDRGGKIVPMDITPILVDYLLKTVLYKGQGH